MKVGEHIYRAEQALKAMEKDNEMSETIDCRSKEGVITGLIDGIIAQARVIKSELNNDNDIPKSIKEALKDLQQDEDVAWILNCNKTERSEYAYVDNWRGINDFICSSGMNLSVVDWDELEEFGKEDLEDELLYWKQEGLFAVKEGDRKRIDWANKCIDKIGAMVDNKGVEGDDHETT